MTAGYVEFEFDLPEALLARLVRVLDDVEPAPLLAHVVGEIPEEQGIYQLFLVRNGKPGLVYVGKTDATAGLRIRLARHATKIRHRVGLEPSAVLFKAVRVYVFTAVDLESQLISHYGGLSKVSWNGSGFGSNDPGRERDTTNYKVDHFDAQFPIDTNRAIEFEIPNEGSAASILKALKRNLPYLVRFESAAKGSRLAHEDLENTHVTIDASKALTAENMIAQTVEQLPMG